MEINRNKKEINRNFSVKISINFNQFQLISILFLFCFYFSTIAWADSPTACFKNDCFKVEIVQTAEEMTKGLMDREQLATDAGMLFIFPEIDFHSFWMKNTKIPLDIIWMDEKGVVVDLGPNLPPCLDDPCPVYSPSAESKYVLEINGGAAQKINLKLGDQFVLNLPQPPK